MLSALFAPFVLGLVISLASGNVIIPMLRKLRARQTISTDAPKSHAAKAGTPTMGGIILLVGGLLPPLFFHGPVQQAGMVWAVLLCTAGFAAIGFLDDYLIVKRGKNLGLRAREKLALQFACALAFSLWIYFVNAPLPGMGPSPAVRALWTAYHVLLLVGMSNAVNLTDGLDGLAAGVSLPVWAALAFLGAVSTQYAFPLVGGVHQFGIVVFCAAFAGATLGYLWYNAHPAQVFMGDTGSLAVGGGIAAAAIALRLEFLVLLLAAVHLAEAASVTAQVISFKTTGKRIFKRSPFHHHFEELGFRETHIVARFAIVSALCAGLGLALVLWRA